MLQLDNQAPLSRDKEIETLPPAATEEQDSA